MCRRRGRADYGKAVPGLAECHRYGAFRCIGSDHRIDGKAVCINRPLRSDRLKRVVWAHIEVILNDPQRIAHEYRSRLMDLASESQPDADAGDVERRIGALRRGVGRLIVRRIEIDEG